ncbi:S-adenosyl-L-methionine-dependent methyltransferase [Aulographum hederae CBS 113979]|uniref:S-adenosyl-L-methionine-dependent methyltransferase n=1 Tax=Aulographum hederae CBS 113979 TaxID=1176131 RepID=A0A6G1GWN5_9PEZI|nr:S-adenosyl-L-methionine-dependent methyltransferase [Aulographum hederae CBS 113979]
MSLYYEAASILANTASSGGSLKSRIYNSKHLKSKPAQVFALVTEATRWSAVLKEVVERSGILKDERKLTPILAVLLSHDLILSKSGIAAPNNHVLKLAILRHKARLNAEFTKLRLKRGFPSVVAFRSSIEAGQSSELDVLNGGDETTTHEHPRWIRVNTIKSTVEKQLETTFKDYQQCDDICQVGQASATDKVIHIDKNIPNLLALPPRADFSKSQAYQAGEIVFQDKASCFPACLLDPQPGEGDVIDACAAPGNKTTHLAALLDERCKTKSNNAERSDIVAFERDSRRADILQKMVGLAGADDTVAIRAGQDFLRAIPSSNEMQNVGYLLLDPSCSGSGIVGRDDTPALFLPSLPATANGTGGSNLGSKKRKRKQTSTVESAQLDKTESVPENEPEISQSEEALKTRLASLSAFQLKLLLHAMSFPSAREITYSTCSIHTEENEGVVMKALASTVAREAGWRILKREQQVDGMKKWHIRGELSACEALKEELAFEGDEREVAEGCIRCEKGTKEGTMGFFVAGFVRSSSVLAEALDGSYNQVHGGEQASQGEEVEWEGFSDDGDGLQLPASGETESQNP